MNIHFSFSFWLRIAGRGIHISRGLPILFSERNGFDKSVRILGVKFKWLSA